MKTNQIVGLQTLKVRGVAVGPSRQIISTPTRGRQKRVFSDSDWLKLNRMPTQELKNRIQKGDDIILMMTSTGEPSMTVNILASNIKFQQDEIQRIIDYRSKNDG